jgi:hypothetical protein
VRQGTLRVARTLPSLAALGERDFFKSQRLVPHGVTVASASAADDFRVARLTALQTSAIRFGRRTTTPGINPSQDLMIERCFCLTKPTAPGAAR